MNKDNIRKNGAGMLFISIEKHKTSRTASEPKPRTVPLSPKAEEILKRQLALHPNSNVIFVNDDGMPYTRYSLKTRLRRLCLNLKIKVFCPYALRHTFASLNSDNGAETTSLSNLMGHSSTRTVQRYISNSFPHYRDMVDTVENSLHKILEGSKNG